MQVCFAIPELIQADRTDECGAQRWPGRGRRGDDPRPSVVLSLIAGRRLSGHVPMPSKKKKYNARFPPARIKKIMQADEEVGKVAAVVPVIICEWRLVPGARR